MRAVLYYLELAILVLALCFTHLKLLHKEYLDAIIFLSIVLIYRYISIYKTKKYSKLDEYNKNIIAELQKRIANELHFIAPIDQDNQFSERDQQIINKLEDGQSGKSISEELGVHVSTISRIKKKLNL